MREDASRLYNSGQYLDALENDKKVIDEMVTSKSGEGFFRKIVNDPISVKFIDLFAVKK